MPQASGGWSTGWLWLGGSVLLAVLWANIAWFYRRPRPGALGQQVTHLVSWEYSPLLLQALRLGYYVGVPFMALILGQDALLTRFLGLKSFRLSGMKNDGLGTSSVSGNWGEWLHDLGWAALLAVLTWVLLAMAYWLTRRAVRRDGGAETASTVEASGWIALREASYHEIHWTFYRNAPLVLLGTYWGTWAGLSLVTLEALLNPGWRNALDQSDTVADRLMRWALAITSCLLFLQTQNLYLGLLVHWGVSWGFAALRRQALMVGTRRTISGN